MINRFSQFLVEEEKTVYFTFGRMNPPTIGHGKLLDTLATKAGRNPYRVYVSQSQDKNKNPLQYKDKIKHVRKMFPKHARSVMVNNKVKNPIDAAVVLYNEGFKNVAMIVGSDRTREFDVLLSKYNGKQGRHGFYNFNRITVVSAGTRDPDAEGVEGMSASKQRDNAKENNFTAFAQGLPKQMSNPDAKKLFNAVRMGMGLKEAREFKNHIQLEPISDRREAFISGSLFHIGEEVIVKKTNDVGRITVLGSNYVIVETTDGKTRQWLDAVEKIQEEYKYYDGTPEADKHMRQMTPGQKNESRPGLWANIHKKRREGRPMRKKGEKGAPTPDQIKRAQENTSTPQDPDIADRKGSQPAKYHTGLSKATKIARDRHFKAGKKGPAPGDANAETKPSKNTLFVRRMMDEKDSHLSQEKEKQKREKEAMKKRHDSRSDKARMRDTKAANMGVNEYGGPPISRKAYLKQKPMEEDKDLSFAAKSKKSGISVATLKKVYARGVAAHRTGGHRPGTSPEQWGHGRVNAFIRKKKQGGLNHDKDLA